MAEDIVDRAAIEAAVELLIRHQKAVYEGAPWIRREGDRAWLDEETLRYESGAWSGGERRIADIALSLLGDEPVNLSDALPGLDRRSLELVLAAVSHAGGSHQHSDVRFDADGQVVGLGKGTLPALYPWPEA
jgi:hypothetical protein